MKNKKQNHVWKRRTLAGCCKMNSVLFSSLFLIYIFSLLLTLQKLFPKLHFKMFFTLYLKRIPGESWKCHWKANCRSVTLAWLCYCTLHSLWQQEAGSSGEGWARRRQGSDGHMKELGRSQRTLEELWRSLGSQEESHRFCAEITIKGMSWNH